MANTPVKETKETKEITFKSTQDAFIAAKYLIKYVINDTVAHKFKYAELYAVLDEVNRVIKPCGLGVASTYEETELTTYLGKVKNEDKTQGLSRGFKTLSIFSKGDNEVLKFSHPANGSADKPEDATYGASTSGERYILNRAFGIPTLDEKIARQKQMKEHGLEGNTQKVYKTKENFNVAEPELSYEEKLNKTKENFNKGILEKPEFAKGLESEKITAIHLENTELEGFLTIYGQAKAAGVL